MNAGRGIGLDGISPGFGYRRLLGLASGSRTIAFPALQTWMIGAVVTFGMKFL